MKKLISIFVLVLLFGIPAYAGYPLQPPQNLGSVGEVTSSMLLISLCFAIVGAIGSINSIFHGIAKEKGDEKTEKKCNHIAAWCVILLLGGLQIEPKSLPFVILIIGIWLLLTHSMQYDDTVLEIPSD